MATFSTRRINPVDGAVASRAMSEILTVAELDFLPGTYGVQTIDGIIQSTLLVSENNTGGSDFTEVSTTPLVGQVASIYSDGFNQFGVLIFNIADDGAEVVVSYDGYGSTSSLENIQAIIAEETSGGSGVGAKSYVINGSAEDGVENVAGSNAYVTITQDLVNVLAGDASFDVSYSGHSIGDYASWTLNPIDLIDENKTFQISMAKSDGTGFAAADLEVVFYDGSSETIIQLASGSDIPEGTRTITGNVVVGTGLTGTPEIRVKALTTGHNITIYFDEITFGPLLVNAPTNVVTDWTAFTMTIDAVTTAPTKATATIFDNAQWRRVGDSMEVTYTYQHTNNAGTAAGSGIYLFGLPTGYTIDTSKMPIDTWKVGACGVGQVESGGTFTPLIVIPYNSTSLSLSNDGGASLASVQSSSYNITSATIVYTFTAKVPIVGWSSNIVTADNAQVEYLYNTDTTNANDTTSFATGASGVLVPVVASSDKAKRVQSSRDLSDAQIFLQVQPDGIGPWLDSSSSVYSYEVWNNAGDAYYGMQFQVVNTTDIDVWFGHDGGGYTGNTDQPGTWTTENIAGTRWRVKVIYNPAFVEAPQNSQVVTLRDEKSDTSYGGTFTSGAWRTRDLNTLDDLLSVGWCSLSSNAFTLSAGSYELDWSAPSNAVTGNITRLQNTTDASTVKIGSAEYSPTAATINTSSTGNAVFTIAGSKVFEIQHYGVATGSTSGFGQRSDVSGIVEIYTQVKIRKIG
jgi:hypothetical protein